MQDKTKTQIQIDPLSLDGSFLSMHPESQLCVIVNEGNAAHAPIQINDDAVTRYWPSTDKFGFGSNNSDLRSFQLLI